VTAAVASGRGRGLLVGLLAGVLSVTSLRADGPIAWVEDFADDPVSAGRFAVPAGHDAGRFAYTVGGPLTVHYDTLLPTAWYVRPLDAGNGRRLNRYDDFAFSVRFRIRSEGFFADPWGFAQVAWGLINSETTGQDRAGGSAGPYAFDCVTFDYFPNVTAWGGPTLGVTAIHGDDGAGFYSNIDFAFGAETDLNAAAGDAVPVLDAIYLAEVAYDGVEQVATLTLREWPSLTPLAINIQGQGGYGGYDSDPTTIQTPILIDNGFQVDSFALTAWQDTYSPSGSSVIADVEFYEVSFQAAAVPLGDVHVDRMVDGRDIAVFVDLLLAATPDPDLVARGDFSGDGVLDLADVGPFIAALLGQ